MSLKILAAVGAGMSQKVKKSYNKVCIRDGLGLCRSCPGFDNDNYPKTVQVSTEEYFDAICNITVLPCYLVRESLLTCKYFKSPLPEKKPTLLARLIKCFQTNDWSYFKE